MSTATAWFLDDAPGAIDAFVAGQYGAAVWAGGQVVLKPLKVADRLGDAWSAEKKLAAVGDDAARATGAVFKTTKEAAAAAEKLGFRKVNERVHGQAVFSDGKRFITRDVDGHQGGAWKVADSIGGLAKKETRSGTYSADLSTQVGD